MFEPPSELSLFKRLVLRLCGHVYIGSRTMPGWSSSLPFYAFRCPVHGLVVDYPRGFNEKLRCPLCFEDMTREADAPLVQTDLEQLVPEIKQV
jgi:hypothetical protein